MLIISARAGHYIQGCFARCAHRPAGDVAMVTLCVVMVTLYVVMVTLCVVMVTLCVVMVTLSAKYGRSPCEKKLLHDIKSANCSILEYLVYHIDLYTVRFPTVYS